MRARGLGALLAGTALLGHILLVLALSGTGSAGAQTTRPQLEVRVARGTERGPSGNYVQVLVTVIDAPAGQPAADPYDVFAAASNRDGEATEVFSCIELPATGAHAGFVIVPHGGHWTITATVNRRRDERNPTPPVTYAQGTLDVDVAADSLASATEGIPDPPRGVAPLEVAVLAAHTLLALGWGGAVAILALLTLPGGRRILSEEGAKALDRRLPVLVRTVWWTTGLVMLTGVYNLANSVPYQVPLSIGAVQRVFRLPYGKPYFLALGIKLLAYAAMIGATIPLIARARRRASLWTGASNPMADSPLEPQASDPWEPRDQALVTTAAARPAGVAGYSRPPVADRPEDAARTLRAGPGRSESRDPAGGPLPLMVFATGGTVIVLAVTLLKYLHVLSEAIRAR